MEAVSGKPHDEFQMLECSWNGDGRGASARFTEWPNSLEKWAAACLSPMVDSAGGSHQANSAPRAESRRIKVE